MVLSFKITRGKISWKFHILQSQFDDVKYSFTKLISRKMHTIWFIWTIHCLNMKRALCMKNHCVIIFQYNFSSIITYYIKNMHRIWFISMLHLVKRFWCCENLFDHWRSSPVLDNFVFIQSCKNDIFRKMHKKWFIPICPIINCSVISLILLITFYIFYKIRNRNSIDSKKHKNWFIWLPFWDTFPFLFGNLQLHLVFNHIPLLLENLTICHDGCRLGLQKYLLDDA